MRLEYSLNGFVVCNIDSCFVPLFYKISDMKRILLFSALAIMVMMNSCCEKQLQNEKCMTMTKDQQVVENLKTRRSVRAYKPDLIPDDVMNSILECAVYAPSGMNRQPWELRVVTDTAILDGLTRLQVSSMDADDPRNPKNDPNFRNMFRNAPTVVFVGIQEGPCSLVDCGLLTGNLVNAAWAYGIGSCIQMAPVRFILSCEEAKPYLDMMQFSEGFELTLAIGLGYPDETPDAKPRDMSKIRYIR